jgi:transglutaminase-like putative cysteine protease
VVSTSLAHGSALAASASALADSGASGWPLVEAAQRLVHERFRHYSCLYWWESPRLAFERRRGYCVQYNGALAALLGAVGIECRQVHAFRVFVPDDPQWRMGHVWVRARVDGQVRDVCAGRAGNRPGAVGFVPTTAVRPFGRGMALLTALGLGPLVGAALLRATVRRGPRPAWLHRPMDAA